MSKRLYIATIAITLLANTGTVLSQEPIPLPKPKPDNGGMTNQQKKSVIDNLIDNMIHVEGGSFMMGTEGYNDDEVPVHRVTVFPYDICKYEVTQEEWLAVMGRRGSGYLKGNKYPVYGISWNECQEFISKLNKQTGRTFRLPTEAEWEYAARGGVYGKGTKYSGSNDFDSVAWKFIDNVGHGIMEVGTKKPNELGIYGMSDEVWEWCNDWYAPYDSVSQLNPFGSDTGKMRVYRGGAYGWTVGGNGRVSRRGSDYPQNPLGKLGLRIAMSRPLDGKYAEEVLLMGYNCYMQQNFNDALIIYNAIDSMMGGLKKPHWLDIAKEYTIEKKLVATVEITLLAGAFMETIGKARPIKKMSVSTYADMMEKFLSIYLDQQCEQRKDRIENVKAIYPDSIGFLKSFRDSTNGKWGFCDMNDVLLIPCEYDEILSNWNRGYTVVKKDGIYGFLHYSGKSIFNLTLKEGDSVTINGQTYKTLVDPFRLIQERMSSVTQ